MIDLAMLRQWVGREEVREDMIAPTVLARLAALLDHKSPPWQPGLLPPLGHWLFHLPDARQSQIGGDGHPRRGKFLPPVPLARRMWAGSRVQFDSAIPIGATVLRRSTIADVALKGKADQELVFVTVRHELLLDETIAITEEQDIVYVARPAELATQSPAPRQAETIREMTADEVMLFRYSALSFNAHRIHYDRAYATAVEGYPDLVVQGPLQAMLLMDHFLRTQPSRRVASFSFRAGSPLFCGEPFDLRMAGASDGNELWIHGPRGETVKAFVTTA